MGWRKNAADEAARFAESQEAKSKKPGDSADRLARAARKDEAAHRSRGGNSGNK